MRLEPLSDSHAPGLFAATAPDTFRYFPIQPAAWTEEAFGAFLGLMRGRFSSLPFAVMLKETDQPIGSSSYLDIREEHRGLEIGASWLAPAWRGTVANPETKLLMLQHAFETLGMERVQLKADARNALSIAAMRKLGAVFEGTLRRHMVMPDGYMRDTVMFSIVAPEWPSVKARLEGRRAGHDTEDGGHS